MQKTAIVYYLPDEVVCEIAYAEAKERKADVFAVVEAQKYTPEEVVTVGYKKAKEFNEPKLAAGMPPLSRYDIIITVFPVWDGYPATAFNTIIGELPLGKDIEVILVSEHANSEECDEKIVKTIERHGLNLVKYRDEQRTK